MPNLKTTLAGGLTAAGLLESAGSILVTEDVKKAAAGLILAALGAFLKGLFAQDASKPQPSFQPEVGYGNQEIPTR